MGRFSPFIDRKLEKELSLIVGKENAFFDLENRICYSYDALNIPHLPDGVLLPRSNEEISKILILANEHPFYVIPRGSGSGFTGGSVPIMGGIIVALNRLNRILSIDHEKMMAVVEPGVITGHLQREVEKRGLFYPPDPASLSFCTIGGNVAECAGGPRGLKYGVTRDYVEGLEVVIPTGEIVFLRREEGDIDLMDLMIGSEGTLGIVTRIHLRLIPLPESKATILFLFSDLEFASHVITEIFNERVSPSTMEFLDAVTLKSIENFLGKGFPECTEVMLIIELDGDPIAVNAQVERIKRFAKTKGNISFRIARDKKEEEEIWMARRAISPSLYRLKPNKINEDVVVPTGKLPSMLKRINEISRKYEVIIANFGHAGDGNIHVNILFDRKVQGEEQKARLARDEIFHSVIDLGGTLSGEHGIGFSKAPYLLMDTGERALDIMKRIKSAFDPNFILNPGKIFPEKQNPFQNLKGSQ
jgi:glycolate oxidase